MGFGIWKLLLLLAVVLVIFGPGKLPNAIKDIGKGIKSLRDELAGDGKNDEPASDNGEKAIIVNKEPESIKNKKKKS